MRDALQLKAEKGGFSVENFDPESAGILKKIQRELVPHDPNPISAELYTVNVYTDGGHFAPHKDTPRGSDMFGTLVVCLPSQFANGKLVLSHRGVVQKFDWGHAIQSAKEAEPTSLGRVLRRCGSSDRENLERSTRNLDLSSAARRRQSAVARCRWRGSGAARSRSMAALLADQSFLPEGGTLAYPCCHLYHQDARFQQKQSPITRQSVTMLKGRDHLVSGHRTSSRIESHVQPIHVRKLRR